MEQATETPLKKTALNAQESDLQRKFNSGLLKTLTGGDELTGEKKFEHPFNFSPTHKLVVVSNHRPKVDLDGGMKRRLEIALGDDTYLTKHDYASIFNRSVAFEAAVRKHLSRHVHFKADFSLM